MYNGMSTVISASKDISGTYSLWDSGGDKWYKFEVPCDSQGVAMTFAMDDDYSNAISRVNAVNADPDAALAEKTTFMNNLLNYQIPSIRCTSDKVRDTYYYLWALYFMYHRPGIPGSYTEYPHTVTAVNNFQSPFGFDYWTYTNMAPWVVDKDSWGYGLTLIWKSMLPYKIGLQLPETFGSTWRSGNIQQTVLAHAVGAWRMYEHSGNLAYLADIYDLYKSLWWAEVPHQWSAGIKTADCLMKMADALGLPSDSSHWLTAKIGRENTFDGDWESSIPHWYGSEFPKDVWALTCLWNDHIGPTRADQICQDWVMNSTDGFLAQIPLLIRAWDSQKIPPFYVNTINTWIAIDGMFENHVDADAIFLTLAHIDGMNAKFGFPTAPECWDQNFNPWGDMYYAWDAPVTLLVIEDLSGIDYSVVGDTLTICEHLPSDWDFLETRVPIVMNGRTRWVTVTTTRTEGATDITKTVEVENCPLGTLKIQPWLEDKTLLSADPGYTPDQPRGHISYTFTGQTNAAVSLTYDK